MAKKVLLIGGGTGGHILPFRNLADELIKQDAKVEIVLADAPLDRKIADQNFPDIPVHFLRTGKLRRYFSFSNIIDIFRIWKSIFTARSILKKTHPDILFFKGGFVGFPFLIAVKFLMNFHGKIFSHESDISAGTLTKLVAHFANKTFHSFGETSSPLFYTLPREIPQSGSSERTISLGTPPTQRSAEKSETLPHLLIFGGSQGAEFLNKLSLQCSDKLLKSFSVTLISGTGKSISLKQKNFTQYESLPFKDMTQAIENADIIVSRGGANSLFSIISAKKTSIIIPLPSVARNHQFLNAQYFAQKGLCRILEQKTLSPEKFLKTLDEVSSDQKMLNALKEYKLENSAKKIADEILGLMSNVKGKR